MSEITTDSELMPVIEALFFASGEPLGIGTIAKVVSLAESEVEQIVSDLRARYAEDSSGLELVEVAQKYQFRTKQAMAPYVQELKANRPKKLSPAALETLAIVAYRQPVVKSEIEKIRGVDVSPTLKTLLERKLIKIAGQQATAGQPSLYATTEEFLKVFGLSSLSDLPNLREAQEIEESINQLTSLADDQEEEIVEGLGTGQPELKDEESSNKTQPQPNTSS